MGTVFRFRELRQQRGWPPAPRFLHAWRPRAGLQHHFGFHALVAAIAAAAFVSGPWFGERPSPTIVAAVIDGDSLRAGKIAIHLDGIDAPELRQTCRDGQGGPWACGRAARKHLRALVARGEIACTRRGRDRHSRVVAACSAGDVGDLGEAMVRAGYAMNSGRPSRRYADAEAEARSRRRGIWRGAFERPEDWRASNRRRQTVGWSGR